MGLGVSLLGAVVYAIYQISNANDTLAATNEQIAAASGSAQSVSDQIAAAAQSAQNVSDQIAAANQTIQTQAQSPAVQAAQNAAQWWNQ